MRPKVRGFVAREGAASRSLDGCTIAIVPPSTLHPGPPLTWWHHEQCAILTADRCTCGTATKTPKDQHG